jgi:predicted glycoside hydrolase/deacetylase ChbG (UPF0249 family)
VCVIGASFSPLLYPENEAIVRALTEGVAKSTSIMVPCPWALHALAWLQEAPTTPFGIHLTVISEQPLYRWGPLVDRSGFFYPESQMEEFLNQVKLGELEREFRAQIKRVLLTGLKPTHLDSHCSVHIRREAIFEMTLQLAHKYGLVLRVQEIILVYSTKMQALWNEKDAKGPEKQTRVGLHQRQAPFRRGDHQHPSGLELELYRADYRCLHYRLISRCRAIFFSRSAW